MDETGWRWSHALDAFGLVAARPGERVYVTSGAENRTYRASCATTARSATWRPSPSAAARASSPTGNVYVANGQIFVYGPSGHRSGRIDVPERPIGLAFGAADR